MTITAKTETKVLVVDDNDLVRRCLKKMLERNGFSVIDHCSGAAALNSNIDDVWLAILDIDMPHMTGLELSYLLKEFNSTMKIILFSGHNPLSVEDVKKAKADAFVKKEDDISSLMEKINSLT